MNVYMVWTEEYYLIIAARTNSGAKYEYARFGDWEDEYFDKQPEGFWIASRLLEKSAPYNCPGEITEDYVKNYGVDLVLEGILQPMWMIPGFDAEDEYDYRNWSGFVPAIRN